MKLQCTYLALGMLIARAACNQQLQQVQILEQQPATQQNQDRTNLYYATGYDTASDTKAASYGYSNMVKAYPYQYNYNYALPVHSSQLPAAPHYASSAGYFNPNDLGLFNLIPLFIYPALIVLGLLIFFPFAVQVPTTFGATSRQSADPNFPSVGMMKQVMKALESDECFRKTVCSAGIYAKRFGTMSSIALSFVERYAPKVLLPYLEIVKDATYTSDVESYCSKRFKCSGSFT